MPGGFALINISVYLDIPTVANNGFLRAGVDEAGRGPLAGPVVVAAVILDPARPIDGLDDSKKLSERRREAPQGQWQHHRPGAVGAVEEHPVPHAHRDEAHRQGGGGTQGAGAEAHAPRLRASAPLRPREPRATRPG